MAQGYLLTDDAVRDLEELEDYVSRYAEGSFVEQLEDEFFATFERLVSEPLWHSVYESNDLAEPLHEYRSANVYHYKVFYYLRAEDDMVIIYRIRHLASDFTRVAW